MHCNSYRMNEMGPKVRHGGTHTHWHCMRASGKGKRGSRKARVAGRRWVVRTNGHGSNKDRERGRNESWRGETGKNTRKGRLCRICPWVNERETEVRVESKWIVTSME